MTWVRTTLFSSAAAIIAVLHSGCASPTQPAAMAVAAPVGLVNKHASPVSIHVTGGKTTDPAWTSQISDTDFAAALESSIRQSGLFSEIAASGSAPFHLEVMLVRVVQPIAGFSMTATLEVNWTLTRTSDTTIVWQRAVVSSHTATTGDAFVGTTRLRMATEGAARKNIEDALAQISKLDLK